MYNATNHGVVHTIWLDEIIKRNNWVSAFKNVTWKNGLMKLYFIAYHEMCTRKKLFKVIHTLLRKRSRAFMSVK